MPGAEDRTTACRPPLTSSRLGPVNGEDETWAGPYGGPPPQGPGPHRPPGVNPGAQGPTPQGGYFDDPYQQPPRQNWGPTDPHYRPHPGQQPGQYGGYQGQGGRPILDQEPDQGAFGRDPYEYDDYGDDDYRREDFGARRGPGGILWFVLAAVAVTLLGLGFAAFSVLSDGGDDLQAEATSSSTGSTLEPTTTSSTATTASTLALNALDMQLASSLFVCDGTTQPLGQIRGAEPNEEITFTSPQSSALSPGQADELGNLPIRWNCTPDQIGTTWDLTATGVTSNKTATVRFTGASAEEAAAGADAAGAEGSTATSALLGPLTVEITENPFSCNGEVRQFALLSGATPEAEITFTSPQSDNIRPGTVDASGDLTIRWSCMPDQVGTVWELTATEAETGRTVDFTITGQ